MAGSSVVEGVVEGLAVADTSGDGKGWSRVACFGALTCLALQVLLLAPIYLLSNQPEEYDTHLAFVVTRGATVSAVSELVAAALSMTLPLDLLRLVLRGGLLVAVLMAADPPRSPAAKCSTPRRFVGAFRPASDRPYRLRTVNPLRITAWRC